MTIRDLRILAGPNVWATCPVLEIALAGDDSDRARALLAETLRLQVIAGTPVAFSAVKRTGDVVLGAVEFAEEPVARAALEIAVGPDRPSPDDLTRLKKLPVRARLQSAVSTTYDGARKLGIPVSFLSREYHSYLVLGQGSKQHRVRVAEPDVVSGVGRLASTDKHLTNQLLRSVGVPVARGKLLAEGDDPWAAANEVGLPVAIKPFDCDMQIGVSLDLRTQDRVEAAFRVALENSYWALVEHFAPGMEHRVIVVGDRVVAVTRIEPPRVVGDGARAVAELVAEVNRDPRRGAEGDGPLYRLKLDDVAETVLASQGMTTTSVPAAGQVVLVRRDPPYFKNGGNLTDLTDVIHPTTAAHCVAAARMMQIPMAGLDVVAVDIARPLEEQEGIIVEVNSNPGLWLHLAPWADSPRPVGEELVAWLFRGGNNGRIPVAAIVGDEGGTVARHLTTLLTNAGMRVGAAGPAEMSSAGRRWPTPPGTPQDRAYVLLRNPEVDVALIQTTAEELLAHGFATDRCDVAVLLSPPPAEFVRALTNALGPKGVFVTTSAWSPGALGVDASRLIRIAGSEEAARAAARALGTT